MESSNLCILASLQSSLLVLIWLLSGCGLGACRARHDKAKFTENGFHLRFRYRRFCRFIRAEDFSLPFLCKISIACLPFPRVAFVVLFPTKLVLLHSDFNCKRYGFFGLRKRVLPFPFCFYDILLDYDVSLHILVVLVVTIPMSPRLSKTEFVGESYSVSVLLFFCVYRKYR